MDRMDHHCPWIDNCVGLGNQRAFFCFIVLLFLTIVGFYYTVVLYAFDTVLPGVANASFADFVDSVTSGTFGPELQPILVLLTAAFDLVWLAFVGALVCRQAAYMAVNVTTYEVLVRPSHVQRRFPKSRGKFWFLQGAGVVSGLRHCLNYWMLNTDEDTADFAGLAPQDSFPIEGRGLDHDPAKQQALVHVTNGTSYNSASANLCQAPGSGVSGASGGSFPPQAPAFQYSVPGGANSRPYQAESGNHASASDYMQGAHDSAGAQTSQHFNQVHEGLQGYAH